MSLLQKDGRLALRLLAEIEPVRRARRTDQFAQRFGRVMAIARFDHDRIRLDDQIARLIFFGQGQRRLGRLGVRIDRGMREILGPSAGRILEQDDAVDQAICSDDVAHGQLRLQAAAPRLPAAIADTCGASAANQDRCVCGGGYFTDEKRKIMLME